ncbi:FCD domain-containing protein [Pontibacillus yanchengensis]|uniref:FCD domain-containing protein n=1 Tax=Pontibacillus yanchengensis TaxID=462910 RepID=A0ACC7VJ38_9BACI|nr:GntR family transcriptional regulator [Pontibacillus yanchengensis]MYL54782.1 FCD domain-containing protein [Pontibacillus yanchengensis]
MSDKKSMIDHVYQSLKEAILFRRIAPGTQLIEKTISEQLNVSRTPIRNGVKKLEQEGLVTVIPNRGAFVVQPTLEEIHQAFLMRKELESMAGRMAITMITSEDLTKMKELIQEEKETYENNDIMDYIHVNKAFHMFLAEKSGNAFLVDYMERILDQINVYLMLYDVFYDVNMMQSKRFVEHEQIVEALDKQDIDRLLHLIDRHMHESLDYMRIEKPSYQSLESLFET